MWGRGWGTSRGRLTVARRPLTEGAAGSGGHTMQISCRHCGEPYEIDQKSLPRFGASVRCPACGGLFELPARSPVSARRYEPRPMVPGAAPIEVAPAAEPRLPESPKGPPVEEAAADPAAEDGSGGAPFPSDGSATARRLEEAPPGAEPEVPTPEAASSPGAPAVPPPADPGEIARRIVAGLAERHAARLDRALRDGELLSALGYEIAAAWDEFRAEAGEAERDRRHFQDALNERLFGGRRVF